MVLKDNRILLINLPGIEHAVSSVSINLGIAAIAAGLKEKGFTAKILDLNLYDNYLQELQAAIDILKPHFIGFGVCTPQVYVARDITTFIKNIDENIVIFCGGPHPSAMPQETLEEVKADIVVMGEGDLNVANMIDEYPLNLEKVDGICFKRNNEVFKSSRNRLVENLNDLPFPALDLFEIKKYIYPTESCRKNPVGLIETSRGCPGACIFCSRVIAGRICRFKTPDRVVSEMEYAKSLGFGEIHFADDNFITDIERAKNICDLIMERSLNISWVPRSGIRVDYANEELFGKMRESGCYHIPFGIESTSEKVLNICNKGIAVNQIKKAIKMAQSFGFETTGYFMIGLPEQTTDDIKKDIEFVEEIGLDYVKFGATTPYPGTKLFQLLKSENKILTYEWDKYHYSTEPFIIYKHTNLYSEQLSEIKIGEKKLCDVLNQVISIA